MTLTYTQIVRLLAYIAAVLAGLFLIGLGALRSDQQLIGIGVPLLGFALPAANVKASESPTDELYEDDNDELLEDDPSSDDLGLGDS